MSRLHAQQANNADHNTSSVPTNEGPVAMDNVAILDLDIDRVSRLVLASERSLALVNRRALAATLANMPPDPGQVLPPAPPFAEAVAIAREDGQLVERIRLFLATHPRAIEELTPELTRTLVRIFDPSGRTARLINTRSPMLTYAVTGAAVIGALTLLTSTVLLIGTVAGRLSHPAGSPAISESDNRPVSPITLGQIPGRTPNAHPVNVRVSNANAVSPNRAKTNIETAASAGANNGNAPVESAHKRLNGTTAAVASAGSAPVQANANANPKLNANPAPPVTGDSAKPVNTARTNTPTQTIVAANTASQSSTNASGTTPGAQTATQAAAARDAAQTAGKNQNAGINELPTYSAQAIRSTGSADPVKPAAKTEAKTIKVNAVSAAPAGQSATTGASGDADANAVAAAPAEGARDNAARDFVNRNITTINPDAKVEWMRSTRTSPGTLTITALVHTSSVSNVVHYTLHDDGSGFTLVNKSSSPNT